jgi:hypothetical protein
MLTSRFLHKFLKINKAKFIYTYSVYRLRSRTPSPQRFYLQASLCQELNHSEAQETRLIFILFTGVRQDNA